MRFIQGVIQYSNFGALTRVGSADGPLAGTNIWGLLLGGASPDSMVPIGAAAPHTDGQLNWFVPIKEHWAVPLQRGGVVPVPGVRDRSTAYVQLVAWENVWGYSLDQVPPNKLGKTEIAAIGLTGL